MRLRILLAKVNPEAIPVPSRCNYPGCSGRKVHLRSPADGMRAGIAIVPEERKILGIVAGFSVTRNITISAMRKVTKTAFLQSRKEQAVARNFVDELRIKTRSTGEAIENLSGGNQQKVLFARALFADPKLIIVDEPTQGIDVGAKAEVHRIISDLASRGLAIILISSELPEVLAMADEVIVLHEGRVTGTFTRSEATQERVMFAATGQDR